MTVIHNPKYYSEKKSYSPIQTTIATNKRPVTTTENNTTSKKSSATRNKDEYGVNDYDDPMDFYENNYNDFFDYEDAEDYWNENRTE